MGDVLFLVLVALLIALMCVERDARRRLTREVALLRHTIYRLRFPAPSPSATSSPAPVEPVPEIPPDVAAEVASRRVVEVSPDSSPSAPTILPPPPATPRFTTAPPPPSFTAMVDEERTEAEPTEIWSPPTRRERGAP